jgi:hypothetical protein
MYTIPSYLSKFFSLRSFIQGIRPRPRLLVIFRKKLIFYGEELLATRPTLKLKDHPLSAVRGCLFNIFAATLRTWRAPPPSATRGNAMPWWQGTHVTWRLQIYTLKKHAMLLALVFGIWIWLQLRISRRLLQCSIFNESLYGLGAKRWICSPSSSFASTESGAKVRRIFHEIWSNQMAEVLLTSVLSKKFIVWYWNNQIVLLFT